MKIYLWKQSDGWYVQSLALDVLLGPFATRQAAFEAALILAKKTWGDDVQIEWVDEAPPEASPAPSLPTP